MERQSDSIAVTGIVATLLEGIALDEVEDIIREEVLPAGLPTFPLPIMFDEVLKDR
jgi:hypothetical protein